MEYISITDGVFAELVRKINKKADEGWVLVNYAIVPKGSAFLNIKWNPYTAIMSIAKK